MDRPLVMIMVALLCAAAGCSSPGANPDMMAPQHGRFAQGPRQSASLALSADGTTLAVVNPDADSLSIIDTAGRSLRREIALGPRPAQDADGRYEPALGPRSVDLSPDGELAYVACQFGGQLLTVDVAQGTVVSSVRVGAEPVAVLLDQGGAAVYVSVYQSGAVVRLPLSPAGLPDPAGLVQKPTTDRPWGLALSSAAGASGATLYVTRFLLHPGVDLFDPGTLQMAGEGDLADVAPRGNRLLSHGVARGLYGPAVRPGQSGQVWLPHLLLATDTAQPNLDFQSTAFPAVSVRNAAGQAAATLTVAASSVPGDKEAFSDVVSGPRALAFTPDGGMALMLDMSSEDVLLLDAEQQVEINLVRPLPGALPEGLVVSPDGSTVYVDERASGDVAVLKIAPDWRTRDTGQVTVDGTPIARMGSDPMPAQLRLGQQLFYSANSKKYPLTQNFWMSCAICHLEGRTDAVTWRFLQGPRDTPTNAGGTLYRGFLQRNAVRNSVMQYNEIVKTEQGGLLDVYLDPTQKDLCAELPQNSTAAAQQNCAWLKALAAYVNDAIPLAKSPALDPQTGAMSASAVRGAAVFQQSGCTACHQGTALTDSATGNTGLDLDGPLMLHDVGTCVTSGDFPDQPIAVFEDRVGQTPAMRPACQFNTPSLHGLFDTAPYLHDGRYQTLDEAVDYFLQHGNKTLADADKADLLTYLRSL